MEVKTNTELAAKLRDVATNYKTLYVMGCFGAPMTEANKTRYCNNRTYALESRAAVVDEEIKVANHRISDLEKKVG